MKEKKTLKEKEPEQSPKLPPRNKMVVKKSQPKPLPSNTKYYPYISAKAKESFSDFIRRGQVIKERALACNEINGDADIKNIIESLGWSQVCAMPGEAVGERSLCQFERHGECKVFVRVEWIDFGIPDTNDLVGRSRS